MWDGRRPGLRAVASVGAVVGLVLLAGLAEYREGRPVRPPMAEEKPRQPAPQMGPMGALAEGARMSAATAAVELRREERERAKRALREAGQAAALGARTAGSPLRERFRESGEAIQRAREALAQERLDLAAWQAAHAAALLSAQPRGHRAAGLPPAFRWSDYVGAWLINAQGRRIGELERLRESPQGEVEAVIILGGMPTPKIADLGGTRLAIPADRLVFGPVEGKERPLICAPTFESDAAAVEQDLRAAVALASE